MGAGKQDGQDRRSLSNTIANQNKLIMELRARVICRSPEQKLIQRAGKERVKLLLGGGDSAIYNRFSRKYYASLWKGYRKEFTVGSYRDTKEIDFDRSTVWIGIWSPPGPLKDRANQIELDFPDQII